MSEPAQGGVAPTLPVPQVNAQFSDQSGMGSVPDISTSMPMSPMQAAFVGQDGNDSQAGAFIGDSSPGGQSQKDPLQAMASALPQYVQQQTDTLNPPQAGGSINSSKEVLQPGIKLERPQIDAGLGGQVAEVEPNREMEMPPEVDGFLKKVENNPGQLPHEVVIVNDPAAPAPTKYLAKPVIVLPITPEVEKIGKNAPTNQSVSWLVAWSRKIMKMFTGEVVYRQQSS